MVTAPRAAWLLCLDGGQDAGSAPLKLAALGMEHTALRAGQGGARGRGGWEVCLLDGEASVFRPGVVSCPLHVGLEGEGSDRKSV